MNLTFSSSLILLVFLTACQNKKTSDDQVTTVSAMQGLWQMQMELEEGKFLPFTFDFQDRRGQLRMRIFNSNETIEVNEIEQRNDSLFIQLPILLLQTRFPRRSCLQQIQQSLHLYSWEEDYVLSTF